MKIINLTAMALAILLAEKSTSQAVAPEKTCSSITPAVVSKAIEAINVGQSGKPEIVRALKTINNGVGKTTVVKLSQICINPITCLTKNLEIDRLSLAALPENGICKVNVIVHPKGKTGEIFIPVDAITEL